MEDIRPVEVIGFNMRKIANHSHDWPRTDGLEPVLSDLYSLTVACSFGMLVLPIFLLDDL
jgi:hypothetical protein